MSEEPQRRPVPQLRTEFRRGEVRTGITFISLGAVLSVFGEVGSLEVLWGIPSIVIALLLGAVFTKTALLWTSPHGERSMKAYSLALIPTFVWLTSVAVLYAAVDVTGEILRTHSSAAIALCGASFIGALWPLVRRRV